MFKYIKDTFDKRFFLIILILTKTVLMQVILSGKPANTRLC